jgi:hypothetical protein
MVPVKVISVMSNLRGPIKEVQYNLGNPTYMGPRYSKITENDGLLEKVGTNY